MVNDEVSNVVSSTLGARWLWSRCRRKRGRSHNSIQTTVSQCKYIYTVSFLLVLSQTVDQSFAEKFSSCISDLQQSAVPSIHSLHGLSLLLSVEWSLLLCQTLMLSVFCSCYRQNFTIAVLHENLMARTPMIIFSRLGTISERDCNWLTLRPKAWGARIEKQQRVCVNFFRLSPYTIDKAAHRCSHNYDKNNRS